MPKESPVFELLIRRGQDRFVARVLASTSGTGAETPFSRLVEPGELRSLTGALRGFGKAGESGEPQGDDLARRLGARMFQAAFANGVGQRYREALAALPAGERLQLRLRLDPDLEVSSWPWELLYDPKDQEFLAHGSRTLVVRWPDLEARVPKFDSPARLNILVAVAEPRETAALDTARELERVCDALRPLERSRGVRLQVVLNATRAKLEATLRGQRVDVLHFIGHGAAGQGESPPALLLSGESGDADRLEAGHLVAMLPRSAQGARARSPLQLVILNSCDSCREPESPLLAGLAQSLLAKGVPAVIGMQAPVSDESASQLTGDFYAGLAEGLGVEEAMSQARRGLYIARRPDWFTPVLFLRGERAQEAWWLGLGRALSRFALRRRRVVVGLALGLACALTYWVRSLLPPTPPRLPGSDLRCPSPPGLELHFVLVEPGSFQMGGVGADQGVPHEVTISRPFCLAATELTAGDWAHVMGKPEPGPWARNRPANNMGWDEAQEFLEHLNREAGRRVFRLPTEAEWEYAAHRDGEPTSPHASLEAAQQEGNCRRTRRSLQVASYPPNPRGLFDMMGNVSEWVEDWYGEHQGEAATDPRGPASGTERVRKGGSSWNRGTCTPALRDHSPPQDGAPSIGFRVARDPLW